jgi:hypothetical protein
MVDSWGNIPYSQALQGNNFVNGTITPTYDSAAVLYGVIAGLVNTGIAQLNNSDPGALTPGGEDVIYGGNAAAWVKFGNAIKARLYIHQSKGNSTVATNALAEIDSAFQSNADNAQYALGNNASQTSANSWYQFGRDREGYVSFTNTTLAAEMSALNDPRFAIFYDAANDGLGGSGNHFGGLNDYYGSAGSPTEFITYDELLFAKAEATLTASGNVSAAQGFYQAAITANMTKLGVVPSAITTYITANGTLPLSVNAAIAQVASQEYIALFLNPEAWTLWRRTGIPVLTPVTGNQGVPRRFLYPQSEINYNSANTPSSTLFAPKIFWDN